jgi:hypothetical protein
MSATPITGDPTPGGGAASSSATTVESWFEAIARAWGQALDAEAQSLTDLSNQINAGDDQPSSLTMLTAASQKFNFLANSESTSVTSIGQALETMARKQ